MGLARVLVVDEEPHLAEVVAEALEDEGYDVRLARTGAAGLDAAATWRPDVLLLDLRMRVMDAAVFVQAFREVGGDGVPVLLLSGAHPAVLAQAAVRVGADGYIAKPFALDDLLVAVSRLAARSSLPTAN